MNEMEGRQGGRAVKADKSWICIAKLSSSRVVARRTAAFANERLISRAKLLAFTDTISSDVAVQLDALRHASLLLQCPR